jgi:hypothetical protein
MFVEMRIKRRFRGSTKLRRCVSRLEILDGQASSKPIGVSLMKRIVAIMNLMIFALPFAIGCDKQAEVNSTTTTTTSEGTSTETEAHKIETNK